MSMRKIIRFLYAIFISIMCFVCAFSFSSCMNYIAGREYDTIEELHADLVYETDRQAEESLDFHPRDLIDYFQIEDKWFMLSTYSRDAEKKELIEGYLFLQEVYEKNGKFIYEERLIAALANIPLHNDYSDSDYGRVGLTYFCYTRLNGKKKSIGFAYKPIDATYDLYYDGVKMQTREMVNPFTGETFYLCYAVSDKGYSLFKEILNEEATIHTLEVR